MLLPLCAGGIIIGGLTMTLERSSAPLIALSRGEAGEYHHWRNLRARRIVASGFIDVRRLIGMAKSFAMGLSSGKRTLKTRDDEANFDCKETSHQL